MNIQKPNTKLFQTKQNPEIKHTKPTQINIHKPNTNIFQAKQNPKIKHTKTHKNEHTNTQYKHISNKTHSGNKTHKTPQA